MRIRSAIIAEIQKLAGAEDKNLPMLTDDLVLSEVPALDSLTVAVLVVRLEETLGLDPFTDSEDVFYPVTLGDFIRTYERVAHAHQIDS